MTQENKIIQEWDEWEDLPDTPKLDQIEISNMDYKAEIQKSLNDIQSKNELGKEDYTKIINFQARFVLFLSIKDIDIPKLNILLHDLRVMCIMKEKCQKIIEIFNLIPSFYPQIDALPRQKRTLKQSQIYQKRTQEQNHYQDPINYQPKSDNAYNSSKPKYSRPQQSSQYNQKPKENNYMLPKSKIIDESVNPFQSLAKDDVEFDSPYKIDSEVTKYLVELKQLINVYNGIIDEKVTKNIAGKINQISMHMPSSTDWKEEVQYFRNRKMVPFQHIVYLNDLIAQQF